MSTIENYFGIDFGTTNSAVVGIRYAGKSDNMTRYSDESGYPFPSLIVINKKTGKVYCGRKAWEERRKLSQHAEVITSIKSYIGKDKKWHIADKDWTPPDIVTQIFLALKELVKKHSDTEMKEAVVAIPVGFSSEQRKILRKSAENADLHIKSFVSESTAAIFKNYNQLKKYKNIGVFDWGGGTLDVSIIKNDNGKIQEIATDGMKLGGDDIDLKMANWIHKVIMKKKGGSTNFEDMTLELQDRMILKSEIAKRNLSDEENTCISINDYGEYGYCKVIMDQEKFALLIKEEVNKVVELFECTVKSAGMNMFELECIVMVGGSSNLVPLIEEIDNRWQKQYDIEIIYPDESEWSVAEGAAMLSKNPGTFKINQEIGLILSDDTYYSIMTGNESIDFKREDLFSIVRDEECARFIFSDNKKTLGYENVSVYGFFQEMLKCKSYIDENLVFNMEIKSNNKPEKFKKKWQYANVKYYYQLPEIEGDKNE